MVGLEFEILLIVMQITIGSKNKIPTYETQFYNKGMLPFIVYAL